MAANVSDYIAAGNIAARQTSNIQGAAIRSGADYSKVTQEAQKQRIQTEIAARRASAGVVQAGMRGQTLLKGTEMLLDSDKRKAEAAKSTRKAGSIAAAGMLIGEGLTKDPPRIKQEPTDYSALDKNLSEQRAAAEQSLAAATSARQEFLAKQSTGNPSNSSRQLASAPSGGSYTKPQIIAFLRNNGFKGDANTFASIGMAESGGLSDNDTVKSGLDPDKKNEFSVGLFQINTQAHMDKLKRRGLTIEDLRDPNINAQIAIDVYKEAGGSFKPWGAYTNNSYKKFL